MLVQLYRDNYINKPIESLETIIYSGNYNGDTTWFSSANILDLKTTANLSSLQTITSNYISTGVSSALSIKSTGFFRAKKTGTHRFFTSGNGQYILEIDGDDIIVKNSLVHESSFANKSMIAGRYYSFNLYYGFPSFKYPSANLSGTIDTTTLSSQPYGNGTYVVTYSSQQNTREARKLFSGGSWRPSTSNLIGGYAQIELPSAIILGSYQVNTGTGGGGGVPTKFQLEGSNDNFVTKVLLNTTNWGQYQGSKIITIDPPVNQAFKYFRLTNLAGGYGTGYIQFNYPLLFYESVNLSSGYLEPNADGTNSGSTNPADFITNATELTTYYDINPEDITNSETTADNPLVLEDDTLQGKFRVSPLALYFNRTQFTTGKHSILYIASDDLFNSFNATYKNYIQLHEKPVANENERKRFTQFSSDMSFECELNGRIEVTFRRGVNEPTAFRYAMLILDVSPL